MSENKDGILNSKTDQLENIVNNTEGQIDANNEKKTDFEKFQDDLNGMFKYVEKLPDLVKKHFLPLFESFKGEIKTALKKVSDVIPKKSNNPKVTEEFEKELVETQAAIEQTFNIVKKKVEEVTKEAQKKLNQKKKVTKERKIIPESATSFDLLLGGKKITLEFNEDNFNNAQVVYDYLNKKLNKKLGKDESLETSKLQWVKHVFETFDGKQHNAMRSELRKWLEAYKKHHIDSSAKTDEQDTKVVNQVTDEKNLSQTEVGTPPDKVNEIIVEPLVNQVDQTGSSEPDSANESAEKNGVVQSPAPDDDLASAVEGSSAVTQDSTTVENQNVEPISNESVEPALDYVEFINNLEPELKTKIEELKKLLIEEVNNPNSNFYHNSTPETYFESDPSLNLTDVEEQVKKITDDVKIQNLMIEYVMDAMIEAKNNLATADNNSQQNVDSQTGATVGGSSVNQPSGETEQIKEKNELIDQFKNQLSLFESMSLTGNPFTDVEKVYDIQGAIPPDYENIKRGNNKVNLANSLKDWLAGIDAYLNNLGASNNKVTPRYNDQEINEVCDKVQKKKKEIIQLIIAECESTDNNSQTTNQSPEDVEKALYKVFSELGSANLDLKLEWKKIETPGQGGKVESADYQCKLKPQSIKKIQEWLDKYNLPADKKQEINQKIISEVESRFTKSIKDRAELDYSNISLKTLVVGAAATGVIAGVRVLTGVGGLAASLGRFGAAAINISVGTGAGFTRDKIVKFFTPKLEKLVGKTGKESKMERKMQARADSMISDDLTKIVGQEAIKQVLAAELKNASTVDVGTLSNVMQKIDDLGIFPPEQSVETKQKFAEQLQKIFMVGDRTNERANTFIQQIEKAKMFEGGGKVKNFLNKNMGAVFGFVGGATNTTAVELGRAMSASSSTISNLPLISSAVIGAQTYGVMYEQAFNRARLKDQYNKFDFADITPDNDTWTTKRACEAQAYLELGILNFDPVLEAKVMSFVQKAAEKGVSIFNDRVEKEKASIIKSLNRQSKVIGFEKYFSKLVGGAAGFIAGSATTLIAREVFGVGQPKGGAHVEHQAKSGNAVVDSDAKSDNPAVDNHAKSGGADLGQDNHDINTAPKVVQSVEIKGSINTFTEAIDKAVHQADVATQDNFIHKVLSDVEITQSNRGQLLDRAVEVLSVSNLKMGDAVDVQNLVYKGNHLELKSDGSWQVTRGSSQFEAQAVSEAELRHDAEVLTHKSGAGQHIEDIKTADTSAIKTGAWESQPDSSEFGHMRSAAIDMETVTGLHLSNKGLHLSIYESTGKTGDTFEPNSLVLTSDDGSDIATIDVHDLHGYHDIAEIVAAKVTTIQNVDNNLTVVKSNSAPNDLPLKTYEKMGRLVGVDFENSKTLTPTEISDIKTLDNLLGDHHHALYNEPFDKFIGKNLHSLTHEQLVKDFNAFRSLTLDQGFKDVNLDDLHNFVNKPNSWVDLVGDRSGLTSEGLRVSVNNGQLVTSLKSPLMGKEIAVDLSKDSFNNEVLGTALNKATGQYSSEQQLYNEIKSTVGENSTNAVLNMNCSEATQDNLVKMTSGFLGLQSGKGAAMHEYLSKTLGNDYTSKSGTIAEQLKEVASTKGAGSQASIIEQAKNVGEKSAVDASQLKAKQDLEASLKKLGDQEEAIKLQESINKLENQNK